jgi:hypothetical protein
MYVLLDYEVILEATQLGMTAKITIANSVTCMTMSLSLVEFYHVCLKSGSNSYRTPHGRKFTEDPFFDT